MEKIKVLLIDDEKELRDELSNYLNREEDLQVVHSTTLAEDALAWLNGDGREIDVDVILLDFLLRGGMDGDRAIEPLQRIRPDAEVIAISQYDYDGRVQRMYKAGARGFLVKTNILKTPEAIRKVVLSRDTWWPEEYKRVTAPPAQEPTPQELEIARLWSFDHTTRQIAIQLKLWNLPKNQPATQNDITRAQYRVERVLRNFRERLKLKGLGETTAWLIAHGHR